MKQTSTYVISVLLTVSFSLLIGCGKDSEKPEYKEVEGKVSSINLETDVVKMWYYSPKKQKEIELEGTLASDAEILINGVVAPLEDLRVDDRVKVVGRIEKHGDEKKLVATKVDVTRSEKITIDTATKPAAGQ
ncbi:MAG: hypothetical protein JSV03_16325 [Planctomycetota bacterium]|nr:MAG: hypothetical protein JSV03_16325 [Planctomycetota bacterium]